MTTLTETLASSFARIARQHVSREFPNKLDHIMAGPEDAQRPRALHPIFYGSFDWHSCVHGFWTLARVRRQFPHITEAPMIDALFAQRFTEENVADELAYLARPESRGFERPYGWGWLLALQAELLQHSAPYAQALAPLAQAFAERLGAYLSICDYPIRTGVHSSTAFALRLAADYAERADPALLARIRAAALNWYGADLDCQAWEPSQDDFLSPALMEAECMRRVLDQERFRVWFAAFLPSANHGEPKTLFEPARVADRSDGKIAHLDGLNLSRAWCWRAIASALDEHDGAAMRARLAADAHIAASLSAISGDYAGEHWLASFALLALDGL